MKTACVVCITATGIWYQALQSGCPSPFGAFPNGLVCFSQEVYPLPPLPMDPPCQWTPPFDQRHMPPPWPMDLPSRKKNNPPPENFSPNHTRIVSFLHSFFGLQWHVMGTQHFFVGAEVAQAQKCLHKEFIQTFDENSSHWTPYAHANGTPLSKEESRPGPLTRGGGGTHSPYRHVVACVCLPTQICLFRLHRVHLSKASYQLPAITISHEQGNVDHQRPVFQTVDVGVDQGASLGLRSQPLGLLLDLVSVILQCYTVTPGCWGCEACHFICSSPNRLLPLVHCHWLRNW